MNETEKKVLDALTYINNGQGASTNEVAEKLKMQRSHVSRILNKNYSNGRLNKLKGKPVIYILKENSNSNKNVLTINPINSIYVKFDTIIGGSTSLKKCIHQAKAAMIYPPKGLHTLLLGATGVGKTMFGELMHEFSIESGVLSSDSPFITFNCADYANNPQLLISHLFGSKKGAFTGADRDKQGLIDMANGGILFLDEVHRLPPEGQEMLFTLIDKGIYVPLGCTNVKVANNVLIICATTEDINSSLLNTFTRRIPMTISIPSLNERTIEERFQLVCEFFKNESIKIGKEIVVSNNSINALLLYNCIGNIGQLKGDIQLSCANGFLNCISKNKKIIEINFIDLSENVRRGILQYKNNEKEIENLIGIGNKIKFTPKGIEQHIKNDNYFIPNSLYEDIEKKINLLRENGVNDEEAKFLISVELNNYFRKYIGSFEKDKTHDYLKNIVDQKIIELVGKYLNISKEKLNKAYSNRIFYGLCLHINSCVERIKEGRPLKNHNISGIINDCFDEYEISKMFAHELEKIYDIKIDEDEIGYIAMFLSMKEEVTDKKVLIVVIAHGKATATSMVGVANELLGEGYAIAYDMSLDKSPKQAYVEIKEKILKNNNCNGVLMLVDMGSLITIGEIIQLETNIPIKVIDMVSTLTVIESVRKASLGEPLEKIFYDISNLMPHSREYNEKISEQYFPSKDNVIITLCSTGQGSALKLKNMIQEKINMDTENFQIIPMAMDNTKVIFHYINNISKNSNVIAIIGTINPNIYGIPFISVYDFLNGVGIGVLENIINSVNNKPAYYNEIFDMLKNEVGDIDIDKFKSCCNTFFDKVTIDIRVRLNKDKIVGLIMHLFCCISRLRQKIKCRDFKNKQRIFDCFNKEYIVIKQILKDFEDTFEIIFTEDEICYITTILVDTDF